MIPSNGIQLELNPMHGTAKSLMIGTIGGGIFFLFDLPLAWMMGSMCIVTIFAICGTEMSVNPTLRKTMTAVLGVMLGSSFSPDTLGNLQQWSNGLTLLLISLVLSMILAYVFFRKIGMFDQITAYFSSAPGGFNVMYEVGAAKGGDGRTIALIHATRVLLLVMIVPIVFRYGIETSGTKETIPLIGDTQQLTEYGWLFIAALIGYFAGYHLKLPAHHLMGPLIVTAAFELSGFISASPPMLLVYIAQLVIGTAIGIRFLGTSFQEVRRIILLSCGSTGIMMIVAIALSFLTASVVGVSIPGLVLALSPGGLAEMSLVAFALGIDVAFVSIMHVLRITIIVAIVPAFYPVFERYWLSRKKA